MSLITRSSQRSPDAHLPKWLIVGAVFSVFALGLGVALDVYNTLRYSRDAEWVTHTHKAITGLEHILSLAKDAETGQRGFVLTGELPYLEPYNTAVREINQQIDSLQQLTEDNATQQARVPKLRELVQARLNRLAQGIDLRKKGDFNSAQQYIRSGEGKQQMDALRSFVAEMTQLEQDILEQRENQANRMQRVALGSGVISGLLVLAMFSAFLVALRNHLNARAESAFAIAEQGERWRTTLASIGDAVIATDTFGLVTQMNAVAESLTGWSITEAVGRPLDDVFHIVNEATRLPVANPAMRALVEGVIVGLANHTVLIAKNGKERPIDDSAAPIRCKDGEIVGCVLVFRDVTERREAEKALRHSEQQLRAIYNGTHEYIGLLTSEGTVLEANHASLHFAQCSREDVVGRPFWDTPWFTPTPGAPEKIRAAVLRTAAGEDVLFETALLSTKGDERWFEISLCPIFNEQLEVILIVPEGRDITTRKNAEAAQARLAAIVNSSDDAIVSKDLNGRITSWNPGAERILGYTAAEMIGQPIKTIIPEDRHAEEDDILARLARGESVDHFETVRVKKDGSLIDISITISPLKDATGQIIGASKIAREVTAQKRMQEQLRSSEERFRLAADAAQALIYEVDLVSGKAAIAYGLQRLTGFTPNELPLSNDSWHARIHPDDLAAHLERVKAVIKSGDHYRSEYRVRHANGSWIHVEDLGQVIRASAGRAVRLAGSIIDVTQRKQFEDALRDSEERFRTLADNISQFAWIADASGSITWYNQRWYDYTGTTLEAVRGWGWKQVHHPDHVDRVVARFQHSLDTGELWEDTFPLRGKDGNFRWFLSRAVPIRDQAGNISRWFGTNTDVTEQREAAESLRELADKLRDADRRKDEFLAMLAHELRNPLAPIRNAVHILQLTEGISDDVQSIHAVMDRQLNQLVRLVDDLLDVSRVQLGKIDLRRDQVDLKTVITQAVETCRPALDEAQHDLRLAIPPQPFIVNGDAQRLAQVFSNLLNNASKYSAPGSKIVIALHRDDQDAVVAVKDNGVGIDHDALPHIFDVFTQVESSLERSKGGLGIGLALVRQLVELHGGSVTAKSEGLDRGSEFIVRLPIAAQRISPPIVTDSTNGDAPKHRVLIVDDNRDSARTMALMLNLKGHETRTAHDGLEAIAAAEDFRPTFVLLDIGLPKLNGFEVARKIREQPWGRDIFLAAMTGWGQEEDRRKSTEAGFNAHLVKPVDFGTLAELFAKHSATADIT